MRLTVIATAFAAVSPLCLAQDTLTSAIIDGDPRQLPDLIGQTQDVNRPAKDGSTALQWAIYSENQTAVTLLLDAGADPGLSNREGITPLSLAAMLGNARITEVLLKAGASVNHSLANGESALMMAARTGDTATMQVLLDYGADINARESLRGTTALMWAAANKNPEAVSILLANGADLSLNSATTAPGGSPYLAPTARERIREFYLGEGLRGDSLEDETLGNIRQGGQGRISLSRQELLSRLPAELVTEFEQEQSRNTATPLNPRPKKQWGGLTALHFAAREGDLESVKLLVAGGADINQVSEFGWTPLLTATQNRFYRIAEFLLEQGANPNIANEGGWTPLYIATDNRNIEGGDYPTRKPDMNHLDYIRLLLEAGADPNLRMNSSTETRTVFTNQWLHEEGATPFLRAAQSSDLTLLQLLLDYGADPNIPTRDGVSPLMVAAGIGWVEGVTFEWSTQANKDTIRLLLDLGNDPNARDWEDGRTPLMGAAHKGRNYAVQMLVDAGADLAARDIGSRDSTHALAGLTWQAVDYADGLVRVGVQSAQANPETGALLRKLMRERGLEPPPEGRTLDSICVVDICR